MREVRTLGRKYAHPSGPNGDRASRGPRALAAAPSGTNGHGSAKKREVASASVRIGGRLRALRRERRVPLTTLSRRAGLSPGYLSQIENDLAVPSTTALGRLAQVLEVPLSSFFEPSGGRLPENYVVRRTARRAVVYPGSRVHHELLVPDLRGKLEVVYCNAPAQTTSPTYQHEGEELGYVIRGRLRVTVGGDVFVLERGDAISYPSHRPHFWQTLAETEMIWIATPPSW